MSAELITSTRYKSPLRYPGGKAKLAPFIEDIFRSNRLCDGHYAEPYAGGASVALSLLFGDYARHIHINDLDRSVYAFWHSVLYTTKELCRRIQFTPITPEEWGAQRQIQSEKNSANLLDLGFSTFFLNRTNRSGIIASAGMIGGNAQQGTWKIDARFNREELISRVQRVASQRTRISLTNLDAVDFLAEMATTLPDRSLTYLDPPYYVKGQQRLYASWYSPADHATIADLLGSYPRCWLVSYDYAPEILALYEPYRCSVYELRYTASRRHNGAEAVFFSDDLQIPNRLPGERR